MARVALPSALALSAAVALSSLTWSAPSTASALSCDQRLISVGDSIVEVRARCGEPAAISSRTETRTQFVTGGPGGGSVVGSAISVTVQIDVWVYDFGRRRFMEELTFENGVVRSMRSLGYGTSTGGRRTAVDGDLARREHVALGRERALAVRRNALVG